MAAEACFAESGFDGTSTRTIGLRANINPALIHYYFDSKEALYNRVIEMRARDINAQRRTMLDRLFAANAPGLPVLEDVLEAIVRPSVVLGLNRKAGGGSYATLLNNIANAIDERSLRLTRDNYDEIAKYSIASIRRVMPDLTVEDASFAYISTIRITFSMLIPNNWANRLSEGKFPKPEVEEVISKVVSLVAGGIKDLANRRRT